MHYKKTFILFKSIFSLLFILGGVAHFFMSEFYVNMMPSYLPYHLELVYLSGIIEVVLGLLLLIPRFTHVAAIGIILLLLAVFPANINMFVNSERFPEMSETALMVRLPIQLLLILWAYTYTKKGSDNAIT